MMPHKPKFAWDEYETAFEISFTQSHCPEEVILDSYEMCEPTKLQAVHVKDMMQLIN